MRGNGEGQRVAGNGNGEATPARAERGRASTTRRARRKLRSSRAEALVGRHQDVDREGGARQRPARRSPYADAGGCTSRTRRTKRKPSSATRASRDRSLQREAITRLKDMYEKRRDWEKLVEVMRAEIELLDEADRPRATPRLPTSRRSACASRRSASSSGARCSSTTRQRQGCRRARGPVRACARVGTPGRGARAQAPDHDDRPSSCSLLLKLGGFYGDKLNDDRGAVRRSSVCSICAPDERRAQEQLKKRYAPLRDWDALEEFYSTTDKWDELIRVFEREGDDANVAIEERISLIKRVARLWAEKKERPIAPRARTRRSSSSTPTTSTRPWRSGRSTSRPRRQEARGCLRGSPRARGGVEERLMLLRETGLIYEES